VNVNGYAVLGGVLGTALVTGVGAYLAVREIQTPEFSTATQAYAASVAENAANAHIEGFYGATPARLAQFSAIGARFSTPARR